MSIDWQIERASSLILPWSTSRSSPIAVTALVIEPMRKIVRSGSTGR